MRTDVQHGAKSNKNPTSERSCPRDLNELAVLALRSEDAKEIEIMVLRHQLPRPQPPGKEVRPQAARPRAACRRQPKLVSKEEGSPTGAGI